MPRNAKDSDDDIEAKSGRRTRAGFNPSVLDSPLRRSSRNKQPAQQDGSSPESVSDVSSTGTARSNRRKTATADAGLAETIRGTRSRRNSAASDMSELTETESLPDGPPRRVTRRSVASTAAVETPPITNGRPRRGTRAGSESKSTPPVGRTTRRNRASSLEPETIEEQIGREVETPVKARRRASALPSEPPLAEESEDSGRASRRSATKTVYEVDENASESLNTSKSSRRKSKDDINEPADKMDVDESSVGESEADAIKRSNQDNVEAAADVSHVSQKLEDLNKTADSSETKKPDDESSEQLCSPARGSTYTIESLLSPSTENQEKSPGNKENEIINELLVKTGRLSNKSDIRFSSRNSLSSTHAKPLEKNVNVSVVDSFLSKNYENPSKSLEEVNTDLEKKSISKMIRKERYSVEECVVIIEPMEINRIEKIGNAKTLNTPESPKLTKTSEIAKITVDGKVNQEKDCILTGKQVKNTENVIINDNIANSETNFEISNVVSIADEEKDNKIYEHEPMDVDESPDAFYLELVDTNDVNEEQTGNKVENDKEVPVESLSIDKNSRTSISESKTTSYVVNDEKTSTDISISIPEPQILNCEDKIPNDCSNGEKTSVTHDELEVSNADKKAGKVVENDENVSSESLVFNDEVRILNPEQIASKNGVNDEKTSSEHSISNDKPQALNSEEKTLGDDGNNETTSSEQLILNTEQLTLKSTKETLANRANNETTSHENLFVTTASLASNSEEIMISNVENNEKTSAEALNPMIELTASDSSINNEKPINSDEIEDNLVCPKNRKSSIVTELPTTGANDEETTNVSQDKTRKSTSNANEDQKINDEVQDKSAEKDVEEKIAQVSDDESEYDGYPEFKDIPADEWTGAETDKINKNTDCEVNSVHSVSTERNGSELDFQLIDKEFSQGSEKDEQAQSDYDTDDTLKIAIANVKLVEQNNDKKHENASAVRQETPMDVSSDEEENDIKSNNSVSGKNISLDNLQKINEAKTPNKNISLIADHSSKVSPIGLNSSRRKSLLSVDDQSNENSNTSMKISSSASNSLKKKSLNASARFEVENSSDSNREADSSEVVETPKIIGRKSLVASAKKAKNTLDGRTIVSAKNTPSNDEKKLNETSTKRSRSLPKSAISLPTDEADDSSNSSTESESTGEDNKPVNISKNALQFTLNKQLNVTSPANKFIDKSEKIGSAKKSTNKNSSKSKAFSSDSSDESQQELSSKNVLNQLRQSFSAMGSKIDKNNRIMTPNSVNLIKNHLDSPASPEPGDKGLDKFVKSKKPIKIPLNPSSENVIHSHTDSPASPDPKDQGLDISAKIRSAKELTMNTRRLALESDSEIDDQDLREKLNKSEKIGSAKKSSNCSRSSIISSDSAADDEDSQENFDRLEKLVNDNKSAIDKNYSTIAQVNSDSNVDEDVESDSTDNDANVSKILPIFMFDSSSESDSESNSSNSSKSIDSDIERDMNLHGRSVVKYSDDDVPADDCVDTESQSSDDDDDDGTDLIDFVVDDDEEEDFSDVEHDLGLDKDESQDSFSSEEIKTRKRIIPRPPRDSDSDDSEEESPMNVSSCHDKSNAAKTPIKPGKLDKTVETLQTETESVDLNVSAKNIATKNKNLAIQCSTPKTIARQSLLLEQSNSTKAKKSLNESAKIEDSSVKLDVSCSKKLSKSVCEIIQTPAKLGSSFKITKTPKTSVSMEEQLQMSLPTDLNKNADKTNLSKVKSTKLSTLNQSDVPVGSESPETRFLMKEKLNDSMPALKLQQRAKALRRSILDNLRQGIQAAGKVPEEKDDEMQEESADEKMSISQDEAASETEVSSEKKKKKKKKKKQFSDNSQEIATSLIESSTEINDNLNTKKSKKLKKKNLEESLENKETKSGETSKNKKHEEVKNIVSADPVKKGKKKKQKHEEVIKNVLNEPDKKEKKKKKKFEEIIEDVVLDEADKKERKKKKREAIVEEIVPDQVDKKDKKNKRVAIVEQVETNEVQDEKQKKKKGRKLVVAEEPEVPVLRQKSRRIIARNAQDSRSDEPETMDFTVARDAALRDLRNLTESLKTVKEAKKKKHQENLSSKLERKTKTRPEVAETSEIIKTSIKRLPDDLLENLSHVAERPKKRRKINDEEVAPSKKTFSSVQTKSGNFRVDDGYIPLNTDGGTTQFTVVNLKKAVKHSRKAVAASTFRERMLARNPRQPVSAYLMYKQKQKHSAGADKMH